MLTQAGTVEVRVGTRIWWNGASWTAAALEGSGVVLQRDGRKCAVSATLLLEGLAVLDRGLPEARATKSFLLAPWRLAVHCRRARQRRLTWSSRIDSRGRSRGSGHAWIR